MRDMTPRQIVAELDKHIIGQDAAKKAHAEFRRVMREAGIKAD